MILTVLGIIGGVLLILLLWAMGTYNTLVRQNSLLKEAFSGISVQQKRRYDLIPNLVNTVKGYSIHEKELLESIAKFRSGAMNSTNVKDQAQADNQLSGTLKTLFAVAESYPDLKANQNFLLLQKELSTIENELQLARRYYNGTARNFNNSVHTFPSALIARMFHFQEIAYFELASELEARTPEVKF